MELRDELIRLRESTGMNKKQFAGYFWNSIPYVSGLGAWKPESAGIPVPSYGVQGQDGETGRRKSGQFCVKQKMSAR